MNNIFRIILIFFVNYISKKCSKSSEMFSVFNGRFLHLFSLAQLSINATLYKVHLDQFVAYISFGFFIQKKTSVKIIDFTY